MWDLLARQLLLALLLLLGLPCSWWVAGQDLASPPSSLNGTNLDPPSALNDSSSPSTLDEPSNLHDGTSTDIVLLWWHWLMVALGILLFIVFLPLIIFCCVCHAGCELLTCGLCC